MFEPISIGLVLAKMLVKPALKKFIEKKVKLDDREEFGILVLEIARPVLEDVEQAYGEDAVKAVMRYEKPITVDDLHKIATDAYKSIASMQRFYKRVGVVLSGPNSLAVLIGQAVGMHHFNVVWLWWQPDGYKEIEPMDKYRDMLF